MNRENSSNSPLLLHKNSDVMKVPSAKNPPSEATRKIIYLVADVFCFFLLTTPLWMFNLTDVVQGTITGFFCNDDSIKYPYRTNTVDSVVLFAIGIFATIFFMIVIETLHYMKSKRKRDFYHPLLLLLYRAIGYFMVGASVNTFLTDTAKLTVGRLRPHFMDVCMPNITCSTDNFHQYIDNAACTRTSYPGRTDKEFQTMLRDMRLSFPSGHASFAMYVAVYYTFYLEFRSHWYRIQLWRHLFQVAAIAAALWCSCTRIIDHKHHAGDVVAGIVLGAITALLFIELFKKSVRNRKPICNGEQELYHELTPQTSINGGVKNNAVEPDLEMANHNAITELDGGCKNENMTDVNGGN